MNNNLIKVGSIWIREHNEFILAQVSTNMYAFISLNSGNRWSEPIQLTTLLDDNLHLCIPKSEFKKLSGSHEFKFACDPN